MRNASVNRQFFLNLAGIQDRRRVTVVTYDELFRKVVGPDFIVNFPIDKQAFSLQAVKEDNR